MTVALWLVALLGIGALFVLFWMLAEWRTDIRQATTARRAAQDFLTEMGRHNAPESEERTEPKFVEARELLPIGDEPAKHPRHIPVRELLARAEDEGYALRLNWRQEDEEWAKQGTGGLDPGDFPTAVLPVLANGESSSRGSQMSGQCRVAARKCWQQTERKNIHCES